MRELKFLLLVVVGVALIGGCRWRLPSSPQAEFDFDVPKNNPVSVPMVDRELMMDQVSDELDNYFRIKSEQRMRLVDSVLTEGWIETYPTIGSSIAEPWRKDSTPGYEKLHSTFQTIRRFAKVRVIPIRDGYSVDVKVYKELEDMPQPEHSTIAGPLLRHDNTLDIFEDNPFGPPQNRGWITLGRDFSLEQKILGNIRRRVQICLDDGPR